MDPVVFLTTKWPWLKTAATYYAVWTFVWKCFHTWLQGWLTRVMASQIQDPDWVLKTQDFLGHPAYRRASWLINFLSVKLPTLADFNQQLAAKKTNP